MQTQLIHIILSHILSKSSCPYPHISPLPPPHSYRPTPNNLHSYAPHAQTTSIYHRLTTSAMLSSPKRLYKSTLRFLSFRDTPHIHLTIIHSVLSRLCRFASFIAQVSVPYVNTLWTQALYIFPFMRYDAPRAARIGDNSLNLAQAHLTLALAAYLQTSSRTKCVAQIAELGTHSNVTLGSNYNLLQKNWLKEAILNLLTSPAMEISVTLQLSWNATTSLVSPPKTLCTSDWVARNSLPANATWILSRILTLKPAHLILHDLCLNSIQSKTFCFHPFFPLLNFSINNSSDSAIKTRSSA